MVTSNSVHTKQMRNDVLMICCRVAQLCPDAPFVVSMLLFLSNAQCCDVCVCAYEIFAPGDWISKGPLCFCYFS